MDLIINSRTFNETTCIVDMEGEMDIYTSPQVKKEMVQIAERGVTQVILNLSKIEYMDSSGLSVLIGGLKRLREAGGDLALVGLGLRTQRIFEVTGMSTIFDIYLTEEEVTARQ